MLVVVRPTAPYRCKLAAVAGLGVRSLGFPQFKVQETTVLVSAPKCACAQCQYARDDPVPDGKTMVNGVVSYGAL